jgi:hypothetical protein
VGPRGYGVTAYHLSGRSFAEVELPDYTAPDTEGGAVYGGGALEDIRWIKPNTLVYEKPFYQNTDSSGVVQHDLKRKYEITMTIRPDGKVVTEKKQISTP